MLANNTLKQLVTDIRINCETSVISHTSEMSDTRKFPNSSRVYDCRFGVWTLTEKQQSRGFKFWIFVESLFSNLKNKKKRYLCELVLVDQKNIWEMWKTCDRLNQQLNLA